MEPNYAVVLSWEAWTHCILQHYRGCQGGGASADKRTAQCSTRLKLKWRAARQSSPCGKSSSRKFPLLPIQRLYHCFIKNICLDFEKKSFTKWRYLLERHMAQLCLSFGVFHSSFPVQCLQVLHPISLSLLDLRCAYCKNFSAEKVPRSQGFAVTLLLAQDSLLWHALQNCQANSRRLFATENNHSPTDKKDCKNIQKSKAAVWRQSTDKHWVLLISTARSLKGALSAAYFHCPSICASIAVAVQAAYDLSFHVVLFSSTFPLQTSSQTLPV